MGNLQQQSARIHGSSSASRSAEEGAAARGGLGWLMRHALPGEGLLTVLETMNHSR